MSKICHRMTSRFKNKSSIFFLLLATNALSTTYAHEDDSQKLKLNGFLSVNSQIRSRGISLTDEKPSYMLNLNLIDKSGIYGSVYGFSVDGVGSYGGEDLEIDYLLGYGQEFFSISFDTGMALYTFPGTSGYTFNEFYMSGSKDIQGLNTRLGLMYVPERKSVGDNDKLYVYIDLKKPINDLPIVAKAHLGYTNGEGNAYAGPTGDFLDYSIGLDYMWKNFVLNTSYIGTNINKSKADTYYYVPNAKKGSEIVDGSFMASLTYLF
jgi:uncharacterized protein (TIGR02001 family)